MKLDKSNPRHWWWLLRFGCCVLIARLLRPFFRRSREPSVVVLYGHRLTGNLLAIRRELARGGAGDIDATYLTMDRDYAAVLEAAGEKVCRAGTYASLRLMLRARAIVSDHGLHVMVWLLGSGDLRFFDVWHGIPFKGFDGEDFRVQRRYDEAWVASPYHRELYERKFDFQPSRLRITGYARTDELTGQPLDREALLREFGLERYRGRPLVLFAPTWKQDSGDRSLFPFDLSGQEFMQRLVEVCAAKDAVVLFRCHLNSDGTLDAMFAASDVVQVPFGRFPDTERLLQLADVLICDWSSIAFDYLLLERPTIFLEVPPPFRKGFSLGPEHRFGAVVGDMPRLLDELALALAGGPAYMQEWLPAYRRERERIYGDFADGKSSARCVDALREALRKRGE
ncbi:CDP-glycerol glycerophosphotransferase family protein [Arenimonas sp.]|uniref:CDP-glycerol glycerophosphotransferase family protein n=1 Tax=Arenimonas sp. TaxID=1872635 RepID=UPI0039E49368